MKKLIRTLPSFLYILYVLFSILSLNNCTKENDNDYSALENIKNKQLHMVRLLLNKFEAEMFDCKHPDNLLNNTVVMDTTIVGITKKAEGYFIKAEIKSECDKKYFTELKCTQEIYDDYQKTKTNNAFVVALIKNINELDVAAESDSLWGDVKVLAVSKSVLLRGECLALAEIPTTLNAN